MHQDLNPEEAQRVLTRLSETNPDIFWMVSVDWDELVFVTAAYKSLWGRPISKLEQDPTDFLNGIHPEDRDKARAAMEKCTQGQEVEVECRVNGDEDYQRWVWVKSVPVYDDAGEFVHIAGFVRDITKRKEMERRLQHQRDNLDVLNQMVRHDIRNDLQLVISYLDILEHHIEADGREYLDIILESAQNAVELTESARELSETMLQEEADLSPIPLERTLQRQIDEIRSSYHGAVITVDGPIPQIDVLTNGLLESVFRNLLKNAVQHNDKDVPKITISVTEKQEYVIIGFQDNGPGIPEEQNDEIFGRGETGLESDGTGIGLYLARTLVEQYGGDIWVENQEPEGAKFFVKLRKYRNETST